MNERHLDLEHDSGDSDSALGAILKTGALLAGGAILATAAVNAVIAWNTPSGGARLNGAFNRVPLRYGDAAYFVHGSGSPVLLLHALRPGNSSAEWEENFDALAQNHTVYALDFLGWGLSDKPRHVLRPHDYAEQIQHFAENVIGEKCAVIASGEAAVFALRAAEKAPELFAKLALICPPDYLAAESEVSEENASFPEQQNLRYKLLSLPVIGTALGNWLTARPQLESKAQEELFFDPSHITPGLIRRMHIAAHQPAAHLAHASYFSGLLNTDWREAWGSLELPALLAWGRNAADFENSPEWLALKPDAKLEIFDNARLLPHVEHAGDFNARILKWLA